MIKLTTNETKCATIKLTLLVGDDDGSISSSMFDNVDVDVDVDEVEVEVEVVMSFAGAAVLSVVFVPAIL